jgi:hypothetical protein
MGQNIMIYTSELKLWHFEVLHMFVYEAMHLQCSPIKKKNNNNNNNNNNN